MNESSTAYTEVPEPVVAGMTCYKCSYDLTGLTLGSPCPECGTTITTNKRSAPVLLTDSIANASTPYLRRSAAAALTLGITGLVMLAFSLVYAFFDPKYVAWSMFFACGVHGVAATLVFTPRRNAEPPEGCEAYATSWGPLRAISVVSQCVWIPAGICVASVFYFQHDVLVWLAIGFVAIAVFGIMPASWLLADHADWANDISLSHRLRAVAWMMGFSTAYVLVGLALNALGIGFGVIMLSFGFIINLLFPLAMALYYISAMQYASNASWAIINANEERERAERMVERSREHEREAQRRQPSFATPPPLNRHLADEIDRKHREAEQDPELQKARELIGRNQNKVIGRGDGEGYALEDDQNPDHEA